MASFYDSYGRPINCHYQTIGVLEEFRCEFTHFKNGHENDFLSTSIRNIVPVGIAAAAIYATIKCFGYFHKPTALAQPNTATQQQTQSGNNDNSWPDQYHNKDHWPPTNTDVTPKFPAQIGMPFDSGSAGDVLLATTEPSSSSSSSSSLPYQTETHTALPPPIGMPTNALVPAPYSEASSSSSSSSSVTHLTYPFYNYGGDWETFCFSTHHSGPYTAPALTINTSSHWPHGTTAQQVWIQGGHGMVQHYSPALSTNLPHPTSFEYSSIPGGSGSWSVQSLLPMVSVSLNVLGYPVTHMNAGIFLTVGQNVANGPFIIQLHFVGTVHASTDEDGDSEAPTFFITQPISHEWHGTQCTIHIHKDVLSWFFKENTSLYNHWVGHGILSTAPGHQLVETDQSITTLTVGIGSDSSQAFSNGLPPQAEIEAYYKKEPDLAGSTSHQ